MIVSAAPLRSLCQIKSGGTPSKTIPAYWQGEVPWVSPKDMKSASIGDTTDHITPEAVENSATSVVPRGTILVVVRSGILAHTLPVATVSRPTAFNQDIKALVPDEARVNSEYLYWFVRASAPLVLGQGVKKGATVHSLQAGFLEDLLVPLPPRDKQRRIVDLMSRAEGIIRLRREAHKKAVEFIPALFVDMFGDPATNPKSLPTEPVQNLCDLVRGSSPRPQGDPRYFGGPVPRLMIADITRDGVYVTPQIDTLTEEGALRSRPMKAGDVVMAVSGAVGLPAILAIDACIHDGFVGFRALRNDITSEYFYNFLVALRHVSEAQAVGATFQNLKTDQIRIWKVPVPSPKYQRQFSRIVTAARAIEAQQKAATITAELMFHTLLAGVFSQGDRAGAKTQADTSQSTAAVA